MSWVIIWRYSGIAKIARLLDSYIFLYSDGLVENNEEDIEVSETHLEQALLEAERDEKSFMDSVLDKMIGNREYSDDITLCYIEF